MNRIVLGRRTQVGRSDVSVCFLSSLSCSLETGRLADFIRRASTHRNALVDGQSMLMKLKKKVAVDFNHRALLRRLRNLEKVEWSGDGFSKGSWRKDLKEICSLIYLSSSGSDLI